MKHRYDYYDIIVLEIIDKVFIRYKATPLIFNTHHSIYSTKIQSYIILLLSIIIGSVY